MSVEIVEYYPHLSARITWTAEAGAQLDSRCQSLVEIAAEVEKLRDECGPDEQIKSIWGSRHGKAWSNYWAKEMCNGNYAEANIKFPFPDPSLHPQGERQSFDVEEVLRAALSEAPSLVPTKLYVTPLLRGIQTSFNIWGRLTQAGVDALSFVATVITGLREHKILEHCNSRLPWSETDKLYPSLKWPEGSKTEEDHEYAEQVAVGRNEIEEELQDRTALAMTNMLLQSRDDDCLAFTAHSGACRGSWHFFEADQTKLWGFLKAGDEAAMSEAETRLMTVKVKYNTDGATSIT